jgi:hypothetical protein
MAEEIPQAQPQAQPDFLSGLLDAITTGAQHSYGQVRDDLSSLLQGGYNPGTAGRMGEAALQLPLGEWLSKLGPAINAGIAGIKRQPMRPSAPGVMDAIQAKMQARGQPIQNFTTDVLEALGEGGVLPSPRTLAPRAAAVPPPTMPLPRTGKIFTPAPAASEDTYVQQLITALKSYQDPAELIKAKGRLKPALQVGPGAPSSANLMIGSQQGGHGPLYEAVQGMPNAQMTHGYVDPMHNVFLNDALNTMLYDPSMLQRATGMLEGGTSLPTLMQALGFASK